MEQLTMWQTVLQSFLCHRGWSPEEHIGYLEAEDRFNMAVLGSRRPEVISLVSKWLRDMMERFPTEAEAMRVTMATPSTPLVLQAHRIRETSRADRGELLGTWRLKDGDMVVGVIDKIERHTPQAMQGNVAVSYRRIIYYAMDFHGYAINFYGKSVADAIEHATKEIKRMREDQR